MSETLVAARKFQSGDVAIAADVAGPLDGVPVILQHGGGQTRASWGAAVTEGARRGFRMIALDLRGHGDSDWSAPGDYSLDAYASDIEAVARTLPAPPFVVGASLGGQAALLHQGEGGRARGLVLVDVAHRLEPEGTARVRGFMQARPDGFESLEEAADAVAAYLPHRPRPKDVSGLARNLRQSPDGRYRWHWDPAMFNESRQMMPERLEDAARALKVPAMLIRGRLSDVVSPEGGAGVHAARAARRVRGHRRRRPHGGGRPQRRLQRRGVQLPREAPPLGGDLASDRRGRAGASATGASSAVSPPE